MIDELIGRIWRNPVFQSEFDSLQTEWLQQTLKVQPTAATPDEALLRLLRAATILSLSNDGDHRDAAYRIAASAFDVRSITHPGTSAITNVILSRLGNFPAMQLIAPQQVSNFTPISLVTEEEIRRSQNEVHIAGKVSALTDFQRELWQDLQSGTSVGISAPTSAGKSFVVLAHLEERAKRGGAFRAAYLVPSRALITQIADSISRWALRLDEAPIALVTMPLASDMPVQERSIFVFTQERLHLTQINHPALRFDMIVVDEAHAIGESPRGILLAAALDEALRRNPSAQVLFASPNVANVDVYGSFFALPKFKPSTTRAKAVAQNIVFVDCPPPRKRHMSIRTKHSDRGTYVASVELPKRPSTTTEKLVAIASALGGGAPSLVYANGPDVAEKIARGLGKIVEESTDNDALSELSKFVEEAVHPDYALVRAVKHRVGFHYGRIPAPVRKAVEIAFSDGQLHYLVTTSTLLQGVNFPAKNLFICDPRQGDAGPMVPVDFWNLAGRAGRLGKEFQGNVFLIDYDTWKARPLEADRAVQIQPAVSKLIGSRRKELLDCIRDANPGQELRTRAGLEGAFTQLLIDLKSGRLNQTISRLSPTDAMADLEAALLQVDVGITLPVHVLQQSPTISAHRQQRLYSYIRHRIGVGLAKNVADLVPDHPRGPKAYKSFTEIFKICHSELLGYAAADKRHTRFATIALKWMKGDSLPVIIEAGRKYAPKMKMDSHIRNVLHDIEHHIRFSYVRLMTCYIAVLSEVLNELGRADLVATIPNVPLYLEMGECRKGAIALMAVGLSRMAAAKIFPKLPPDIESAETAKRWLLAADLTSLDLPPVLLNEIQRALGLEL